MRQNNYKEIQLTKSSNQFTGGYMPIVPKKVAERISNGIKRFQPILINAKTRDVNESDTVIIVTDMLSEIFGYDKYSEITSEHAVRSTYCDLATKLNGKIELLIEVKAIGLELKDNHVKQAIDYAANQGVDWVVLTNGIIWKVFKVSFTKPIDQEIICEFDVTTLNPKSNEHIEFLYLLSKEGWMKMSLEGFHEQKQALSKFFLGALILSDPVIETLKRELRKISPDVKISSDQIKEVVCQDVLKREVTEGEKSDEAKRKIARVFSKLSKTKIVKPKTTDINNGISVDESIEEENETSVNDDRDS